MKGKEEFSGNVFFPATYKCNSNCTFCYNGEQTGADLSKKQIFKALDKIKNYYKKNKITFSGGEFTLRNDCMEIVKYAKKIGFETVRIFTNGRTLKNKKYLDDLVDAGLDEIVLSIHGHNSDLHNCVTRVESFRDVLEAILNIKKSKVGFSTNTVITKKNYRLLPQIVAFLSKLNPDAILLSFVLGYGNAGENAKKIIPKLSAVAPFLKKSLKISDKVFVVNVPICILGEKYIDKMGYCDSNLQGYDIEYGFEIFGEKEIEETVGFNERKKLKKEIKCYSCKFFYLCKVPFEISRFSEYMEKAFGYKVNTQNYVDLFGWGEFKSKK